MKKLIVCFALLGLILSCDKDNGKSDHIISGIVLDHVSDLPVENVGISIGACSDCVSYFDGCDPVEGYGIFYTDEDGLFSASYHGEDCVTMVILPPDAIDHPTLKYRYSIMFGEQKHCAYPREIEDADSRFIEIRLIYY